MCWWMGMQSVCHPYSVYYQLSGAMPCCLLYGKLVPMMLGAAQQMWFASMVRTTRPKEDNTNPEAACRRAETEGICQWRFMTSKPILGQPTSHWHIPMPHPQYPPPASQRDFQRSFCQLVHRSGRWRKWWNWPLHQKSAEAPFPSPLQGWNIFGIAMDRQRVQEYGKGLLRSDRGHCR